MFISCVRNRREGKTALLLELLRENPKAYLIVANRQMKNRLCDELHRENRGLEHHIFSIDEMERMRGLPPGPLLVDDLDSILFSYVFGQHFHPTEIVATATGKSI